MESDYFGWRRLNHVFEDVAAYEPDETFTLTGGSEPEHIQAGRATYNFLDVLGVVPRIGRSFRWEEDRPGVPHVAPLTDSLCPPPSSPDPPILPRLTTPSFEP